MVDEAPEGSPKGAMSPDDWGKVKKGGVFAGIGSIGGTLTGVTVVQVAIEQGWLEAGLQQPATMGAIIGLANFLFAAGANLLHRWLSNTKK